MAEKIALASPETKPSNTSYSLDHISFDLRRRAITVQLLGDNGEAITKTYDHSTTPTGATLFTQVNTSDNRTVSMVKKVYARLIADGVLAGTVSGTPD